jgi:type VI secretion system FHA domain protein
VGNDRRDVGAGPEPLDMILTLEVIGEQAAKLGSSARKVFRDAGGSIGRQSDNTWSLPDDYVSGRHAMIKFTGGTFYIEDRNSRNGVFINSPDNRLAPGQAHALRSGDWILIEPYEIRVSVENGVRLGAVDPFGFNAVSTSLANAQPDPFVGGFGTPVPSRSDSPVSADPYDPIATDDNLDPMVGLFGPPSPTPPPQRPKAENLPGLPPWVDPLELPPVKAAPVSPSGSAPILPDDWNDSGAVAVGPPAEAGRPEPRPAPRPVARAAPPAPAPPPVPAPVVASSSPATPPANVADQIVAAVMGGAGLNAVAASPELARDFGKILRIVVEGLMDVLRARREFKDEFRLGMTTLRPAENNPLKFSANVEDALHNLLVKRNAAYLGAVPAFEDAFDDVRNDRMAMLAGMRAAFEMMLQEFDPDRLQQAFDRGNRNAIIATPARLRYWEQYREKFRDMVRDPEKCFRELFGNEFAAAYEEHLKQLKSRGPR